MNKSDLKVGDKLYKLNIICRRGDEKCVTFYIVGETRVSWIISLRENAVPGDWSTEKIKKTGDHIDSGKTWNYFTSPEPLEEARWAYENQHRIGEQIRHTSPAILRQIAALIGYTERQ